MTTHGEETRARRMPPGQEAGARSDATASANGQSDAADLAGALAGLRSAIVDTRYPLRLPSADTARDTGRQLLTMIDDYLLPRLLRTDAALLTVVAGPTGAGKSTLVNSLVRAPVCRTGVLRPTTRSPVLVCHPGDTRWFSERPLLPGMPRTSGLDAEPDSLRLVSAPGLVPGLALLDTPDVDSVTGGAAGLAGQLLAGADLLLFVTTAARYADAVPWGVLRDARDRGTAVALVLDRVPPGAEDEVGAHLAAMVEAHGLRRADLFVLPEVALDGQGLLAERLLYPLRDWLTGLAEQPAARAAVVRQTVTGALAAVGDGVRALAAAADAQVAAAQALQEVVRAESAAAAGTVARTLAGGGLLRGEVLARCRELATARAKVPDERLTDLLHAALATLIRQAVTGAAERVRHVWRDAPGGPDLLARAAPAERDTAVGGQVRALLGEWREANLARVTGTGRAGRRVRVKSSTVRTADRLAVLAVLGSAPGPVPALVASGAERALGVRARDDLTARVRALLDAAAARYTALVDAAEVPADGGERLRALVDAPPWTRHGGARHDVDPAMRWTPS